MTAAGIDFNFDDSGEVRETNKHWAPRCLDRSCEEVMFYSIDEQYEQMICNVTWKPVFSMNHCPRWLWFTGNHPKGLLKR